MADLMRSARDRICADCRAPRGWSWPSCPARCRWNPTARLLRRLLQNFISNAIKYTPRGRVLVGCRRHGQSLQIGVYDTGVGIPIAKRGEIFKEFHRLEQGARIARGLGLGLSIVERLARVLNHGIAISANVSGGSVFSVTVPIASAINHTAAVTSATPLSRTPMSGALIVCIENDAAILDGMKTLLTAWDAEVIAVTDPDAAIAAIEASGGNVTGLLVDLSSRPRQRRRRDPRNSPPLRREHSGHPDHGRSQPACPRRRARGKHRDPQQAGQTGFVARAARSVAHAADGGGGVGHVWPGKHGFHRILARFPCELSKSSALP